MIKNLSGNSGKFVLGISENFPKDISALETCDVTKYRLPHTVSLLHFSENFKKSTPQSHKKARWKWTL